MGQVFQNPTITKQSAATSRQRDYLKARKTDRPRNEKHEESMQIEACQWLRVNFPDVHYSSDTGSGAFNSQYAKNTHNLQQSAKGLTDMTIYAMRRGYGAMCLELKPDGTRLKLVRGSKVVKVYKDKKGKILYRDQAPRQAGDWKDYYIERQATRHRELREAGYCAGFVVGLEHFKRSVCWYFEVPYKPPFETTTIF